MISKVLFLLTRIFSAICYPCFLEEFKKSGAKNIFVHLIRSRLYSPIDHFLLVRTLIKDILYNVYIYTVYDNISRFNRSLIISIVSRYDVFFREPDSFTSKREIQVVLVRALNPEESYFMSSAKTTKTIFFGLFCYVINTGAYFFF
nr:MAG TPA: hypothetical protein [Myoviridae sp. ctPCN11]